MGAVPGRGGRPRRRPNLARRFFRCRVRGSGRSGSALRVRVGPRCAGATDGAVGPPLFTGPERAGAPRTARRRKPAPGTPAAHRHERPPARRGGTGRCPGAAEGPSGRIAERRDDRPRRAVQRSEPCGRTASARDEDLYPSSRDVRLRAPRGRLSAPPEAPQAAECGALADAPPSPPYRGAAFGTGASERAPGRVSLSGAPSRSEASPGGRPGRQRARAPPWPVERSSCGAASRGVRRPRGRPSVPGRVAAQPSAPARRSGYPGGSHSAARSPSPRPPEGACPGPQGAAIPGARPAPGEGPPRGSCRLAGGRAGRPRSAGVLRACPPHPAASASAPAMADARLAPRAAFVRG
jgi:hypothetical protein